MSEVHIYCADCLLRDTAVSGLVTSDPHAVEDFMIEHRHDRDRLDVAILSSEPGRVLPEPARLGG